MKEVYKSKVYSNDKFEQDVFVVLYGRHPLIDDTPDRYQIEVRVDDLEGSNTYIVKLLYDKNRAIKETIKFEDVLGSAFKKYDPDKYDIDDFVKAVLEEAGCNYVSVF